MTWDAVEWKASPCLSVLSHKVHKEMCGIFVIIFRCLPLAALVRLFQVQFSREWFVACQQPNDASQAYVVYLVGRRPSGSMNSLTAALPRDVSIPITSAARKGCWQHRCIFSLFPDSQYFRWHTQWLLRVTSSIELIQSYACYCLPVSIQNQVKQGNSRIKLTVASK